MGRLIAVLLFIAVLVPGVLLARAWWLAAGRRAVAGGSVELAEPTAEGLRTLAQVTGTDLADLCATLTATAERVFGPWGPAAPSA